MPTRVLVPSGVLGLGFDRAALARGVAMRPDIICIDGGSTDSGPFSLGAGQSKYSRAATKSEWRSLMQARAELGVPLVIGTAGTCGTDSTVDWMYDITIELAQELGQSLKIARLYSSQPVERIAAAAKAGQVTPLTPRAGTGPVEPVQYRRSGGRRTYSGGLGNRCRYRHCRSHDRHRDHCGAASVTR